MNSGSKLRWMGCLLLPLNFHLESLFTVGFNLSSPRLAKTVPFLILLCQMPDDFTHQWSASGWERVNWAYLPILFLNLSSPRLAKTVLFVIFTRQWRASGWESKQFCSTKSILDNRQTQHYNLFIWTCSTKITVYTIYGLDNCTENNIHWQTQNFVF